MPTSCSVRGRAAISRAEFLAVLTAVGSSAQQPPHNPEVDRNRIVLNVARVNVLFTVSDKKGRFVTNLTRNDFQIVEANSNQEILEFTAESDLPLRLAILVDTSHSIRGRFRFQQEAAIEFVHQVVRPDHDKALIISFDTAAELAADLTGDTDVLAKAIRGLRPGGGTAMFDAVLYASRDKLTQDQPHHSFRRAIILIGDGDDNLSRHTRDQALEMAQKADVVVYCISTNSTNIKHEGDKVLRYYAEETGGVAFFPFEARHLSQSFENISDELRHQYNVLYRPEPLKTDGRYHKVEIKVKGRNDLVVRARKGYYAPKG